MSEVVKGRVSIQTPLGDFQYNIAIGELEFQDMCWVPKEPPPFDDSGFNLLRWQEKLKRSNEACDMFGQTIARAFKQEFQKRFIHE